ncbi:HlyD family secretion protein [Riemerella anatipestifer]|uniref:HlyD family secretion protein n=1 Tax=Riemerella anatipestifer TaxID=34085 RepID=UPI001BDB0D59|nr:HlyD family efflux transporter periplasmic adaptor subunit [Riemerella anatipestifer]MBT0551898.1 HlyD family efflux transporter periplasmic adaptor subunit [Riemerella anatipestifer]MBT0554018.1 HlyD family efflux transporter periplasmic adaptor subunit [Riemerella anatipestifer]MCE3024617.1 HlyD family secretion protein [Riemerella anatipestifer]MCU7560290.1 HlyD family secretion protein [Riemerella anatipestifer]MDY3449624.1 HlyD family efflux transporter periplasmic adaptor subunit [Rie
MFKETIYLSVLFLIIGVIISLPIVTVPISSSSRGVIRSQTENTKIVSVVGGRVIENKLEKNNQEIKQGETLLIITAEQLDTQKSLQSSQSLDYQAQLQDLNKLTRGQYSGLQTGQYQRELSAMQEKIAQVKAQLELAQKDYNRALSLYNQGVIPKAEYDKFYYDYQGFLTQISSIREQQLAQWQAQKREVERQLRSLYSEIQRINQEQKNYIITAPISGRLVNFSGIQKGNFIIQGQTIGEISPDKSLVAECFVSPKDIGFIKQGQGVKFQIDTYNYNQWGLLEGKVKEIDQNITVNQQTGDAYFRVLCTMDKNYLQLKNGYKGQVGKGMTLTARFHLTDRTLWQLLFDRVDDWFNPNLK